MHEQASHVAALNDIVWTCADLVSVKWGISFLDL